MVSRHRIAVSRKPNYINNNKDEIVRIIEGKENNMGPKMIKTIFPIDTETYEGLPMYGGPRETETYNKVLHDIVRVLKCMGMIYVWGCAVLVTVFIMLSIYGYLTMSLGWI